MNIFLDASSILWTGLFAGTDVEGLDVQHGGRKVHVNTAAFGYENVVNSINSALNEFNLTPMDLIMVFEGKDSKKRRCMIDTSYKANREGEKDSRPPEAYVEFNKLKDIIRTTYKNLGAIAVSQDFVEGDDVLAWLALNAEDDCVIVTNDNDMATLNGVNAYGAKVDVRINGVVGVNKYGAFDLKLVSLYKGLVGDTSDNIKGCVGFGAAAWMKLNIQYGDDGCFELEKLVNEGKRDEVAAIAAENGCKLLAKLVDQWDAVRKSLRLSTLHPEWVNTVKVQLSWEVGMVQRKTEDERLKGWRAASRLVTAGNFDDALKFMRSKSSESPFFCIDFETTNSDESDDWLEARGKGKVDVMGSTIVSCGINFGRNLQYGLYVSVNHADTDNCTVEQLGEMLQAIPADKYNVAHNAAGFELPVAYNTFGQEWKGNGWRGFLPNMIDTRIAASFWDENQPSHGLKGLSKLLQGYDQTTYEEVTTVDGVQLKMHQLSAEHVVAYGLDDTYTASGLWNFFKLFMKLEHTYDAFIRLEQKPMYLSALAYVQGLDIDFAKLKKLETEDKQLSDACWLDIETYLISKGWDGVTCPIFDELTAANIKQAVQIVLGQELKTMIRTPAKLATLIGSLEHDSAETLANLILSDRVDLVNTMVAARYTGKPDFNVGSPKQLSKLLYEVMGMPIRLRNKATDAMREKGIKEGNPRTDDSAVDMAIKFGDVKGAEASVLKSLLAMKSCNTRSGLYWSAIPANLHWKTGRLHPELRQSATNTRRWTSSSINIQQLESDSEGVRSVIRDGKRIIASLDQSSQEVRLMAELSADENLLSCYVGDNLKDTHSLVAHRIAKVSYEEFMLMRKSEDKDIYLKANTTRQLAKQVFFGFLFGAAAPKLAETLGISEVEAQSYIDAINLAFPGIRKYQEQSAKMAETLGYVDILGGSRRHLAKLVTSEDKWTSQKALRQSGNARIQGAAANQIKTVMSDVWDSNLLDSTSLKWLFCVHDEIVVSMDPSDSVYILEYVHKLMTKPFLTKLPSESSIGIGKNFGQLSEMSEDAFRGGRFDKALLLKTIQTLN